MSGSVPFIVSGKVGAFRRGYFCGSVLLMPETGSHLAIIS